MDPVYGSWPRTPYSCGDANDGFGHDRSNYPYQELVWGCATRPPVVDGKQLWAPFPLSYPDLNDARWRNPLQLANWVSPYTAWIYRRLCPRTWTGRRSRRSRCFTPFSDCRSLASRRPLSRLSDKASSSPQDVDDQQPGHGRAGLGRDDHGFVADAVAAGRRGDWERCLLRLRLTPANAAAR